MSIPKERRAPSWSWLSVNGGVTFNLHSEDVMPLTEVNISYGCDEQWSGPSIEYNGAGLIASSAMGLVVEGPLYSIRHKLWRGAELSRGEHEEYERATYSGDCWLPTSWKSIFIVYIDVVEAQKPTGTTLNRQHRLRWASPTHLLPLTRREHGVDGLLLVEDPEEDNVFIRVGRFQCCSQARAIFGGDGFDRDPNELARDFTLS
ncbi:HET-domain-containing protein [Diaporthe eres]|nr:HET-domain-containing protein [Diaporthe eres]